MQATVHLQKKKPFPDILYFQDKPSPDRVFSPDQAAEVETPGVRGHTVWGNTTHHQHEAVTASRARLMNGQQ